MENEQTQTQSEAVAPSIMPVAAPQPAAIDMSLQTFASLNPVAALLVKEFNERERQRRVTTLTRIQRQLRDTYKQDVSWEHLVEAFKALNDLGVGALITGRGPKASRFKWGYSLRDVARAASGEIKFDEMSKAPTGKTRIVYGKNYKNKALRNKTKSNGRTKTTKASPATPAPIAQAVANGKGGVEIMILQDGVYKKYEVSPDKKQLFETLLPSLAVAK